MINATMCFLREKGKTLFLYRNRGEIDIHNGWYLPPGGHIERGEMGVDCIIREFEEETGLRLIEPKLRVIATFYNQGRIMGGKENPEDWLVEVYESTKYHGELKAEHPKAKPVWVSDSDLTKLRVYPGERKIFELFKEKGVYQVLVQYAKEDMIRFEEKRVY